MEIDCFPKTFDLDNPVLGFLFSSASVEIDNYVNNNQQTTFDFKPVIRAGKIIYTSTFPQKTQYNPKYVAITDLSSQIPEFFIEFFEIKNQKTPELDELVNLTKDLGLDFLRLRELHLERQEQLRDSAYTLSKLARFYFCYRNRNLFGVV